MIPLCSQNSVGFCNQITPVFLYYISSRLVTLLKLPSYKSLIFFILLLVASSSILAFRYFFFFSEISTGLTSELRFQIFVVYNFL